jgi:hypothetical protein
VQVQPWGPERIDERMLGLLAEYDTGLPPSSRNPRSVAVVDEDMCNAGQAAAGPAGLGLVHRHVTSVCHCPATPVQTRDRSMPLLSDLSAQPV